MRIAKGITYRDIFNVFRKPELPIFGGNLNIIIDFSIIGITESIILANLEAL